MTTSSVAGTTTKRHAVGPSAAHAGTAPTQPAGALLRWLVAGVAAASIVLGIGPLVGAVLAFGWDTQALRLFPHAVAAVVGGGLAVLALAIDAHVRRPTAPSH